MSPRLAQFAASNDARTVLDALRKVVGASHALAREAAMRRFTRGYRYGQGHVRC
ncbi:hypothetical protein C8J35_1129 [Rhizobium sp. PP-F2F-G38]|nr:hypothetical protein C8J37_110114 [Rhizobium sp. PP-WC-1G-195]PYE93628.1 hypothetical protein C8J35_1129 [Rhizobium sp. PP-F2F-G38]TCP77981.1 hypothetical protein C8J31_1219 [Rhizobium sp. PP-CC-2G-626]TCP99856.1 hypothetical protein C8J34_1359 [Rhizobium sp. PP-F2F-G36]TCQ25826.1 hypothetical protein C8J33_10298 [Rhizobium sp. PP-CC-3G-465]